MKTGLGINKKIRKSLAYINLLRFLIIKNLIGFDVANLFLSKVDKISLQLILSKNGATIGKDCDIETGLIFHNCKDYSNLIIGNNCHIGKNCFFDLQSTITLNDNVVVSMQCTFITHIDMTKSELAKIYPIVSKKILIHKNCYIGANSTILMGVEIGESCLIASNSLVNKKINNHLIVGGIPARQLKKIAP